MINIGFFILKKHLYNRQSRFFGAMLFTALFSCILDIMTVLIGRDPSAWPIPFIWGINIVFLMGAQVMPLLMLFYVLLLTDNFRFFKGWKKLLLCIPFILIAFLLLSSPLTGESGIFYIDKNGTYIYGAMRPTYPTTTCIYLAVCAYVFYKDRHNIDRTKTLTIAICIVIMFSAIVAQLIMPRYLLVNMATAAILSLMQSAFQSPGEYVDKLTGAYNRRAFTEIIAENLSMGRSFSVIAYAIDEFKRINTLFGTSSGDTLLCTLAKYLFNNYENHSIVRLNGDIFAVVINDGKKTKNELLAVLEHFPRVWNLRALEIPMTACRVYMESGDYSSFDEFMNVLDYAVWEAKSRGANVLITVDSEQKNRMSRRLAVEDALLRAVEDRSLYVDYQPICDMKTGRIWALEALARLYDEKLGQIVPSEFIPIAEHNGLINNISEIVLERVCGLISSYNLSSCGIHNVSVNFSVIQCMQPDMYMRVMKRVRLSGAEPELISIEITESAAASSYETLRENMEMLRSQGISFHLDDYGTGYSNMSSLMLLPLSVAKLDKSLLYSAMETDRTDFLSQIVYMFHSFGIIVVCEGIETQEQRELALSCGVDLGQGYYFSRPLGLTPLIHFAHLERRDKNGFQACRQEADKDNDPVADLLDRMTTV